MDILKSRTFWVGAAMFLLAGLHAVRHQIPLLAQIPDATWREVMDALSTGGVGLLGIFLRLALAKKS